MLNEKAMKLLEVATHPATVEGERTNALSMFRRLIDKEGGLRAALDTSSGDRSFSFDLLSDTRIKLAEAVKDIDRLTRERNDIVWRYNELRTALTGLTGEAGDLNDPFRALHGALAGNWRTIGELCAAAAKNGWRGADNTIRKRADNLAAKGLIDVREEEWKHGGTVHVPRAWRIKP